MVVMCGKSEQQKKNGGGNQADAPGAGAAKN